jgi:hypothetical protein
VSVVLLIALAIVIYAVLGSRLPMPGTFPDEFLYGHLARGLANGEGFDWRGQEQPMRAALYVYSVTPAWLLADGANAYKIAKLESAIFCCLTALPVFLLARTLVTRRLALAAAALTLAGSWMLAAGGVLTENLALPLATAALAYAVSALRNPGSRASWLALAFAVLATWSRMQLVVLIPVVIAAHAADAARAGADWRARLRAHRNVLLAGGAGLVALLIGLIAAQDTFAGIYSDVLHYRPSLGTVLKKTGVELIGLTAMCGFLPVLLAAALAFSPRAWADDAVGPLLIVFWLSALALALASGFFLAGLAIVPWGIERYMGYAAPIALLLTVVAFARPDIVTRRTLGIAAGASLLLLLAPALKDVSEERAVGATIRRVHDIAGGASAGVSLLAIALLTCGVAALLMSRMRSRAAIGIAALMLVVLAVQSAAAWNQTIDLRRGYRAAFASDLEWVDHNSHEPVAVLEAVRNALGFEQYDFFNHKIERYYASQVPPPGRAVAGKACKWSVVQGGYAQFDRACGSVPHRFFINDPAAHITFHDEADVVTDPHAGRLVTVNGKPRLRSVVYMPCDRKAVSFLPPWGDEVSAEAPHSCAAGLTAYVWNDQPGTVKIKIRGGSERHLAQIGQQQFEVPPGKETTLEAPVAQGGAQVQAAFDWDARGSGEPEVVGVDLDGKSLL